MRSQVSGLERKRVRKKRLDIGTSQSGRFDSLIRMGIFLVALVFLHFWPKNGNVAEKLCKLCFASYNNALISFAKEKQAIEKVASFCSEADQIYSLIYPFQIPAEALCEIMHVFIIFIQCIYATFYVNIILCANFTPSKIFEERSLFPCVNYTPFYFHCQFWIIKFQENEISF